jgi:hypothetical protein
MYWIHEAPHDFCRHTRYSLERLTSNAGLDVVELHELGDALDVLADISAKLALGVPILGRPIASCIQALASFGRRITPKWPPRRRTARAFPLGYSLIAKKPG